MTLPTLSDALRDAIEDFSKKIQYYASQGDWDSATDQLVLMAQNTLYGNILVAQNDNATSLRCRGPQSPTEGTAIVQSYSGIFHNPNYSDNGGLNTRFIVGANDEMDLELQSPNAIKISAADANGEIIVASRSDIIFSLRDEPDQFSPKTLVFDRIDTGTVGGANTSDVNIKVPTGSLYLNAGVTLGAVVLPSITNAQQALLTPVAGMIIFNTDTSKAEVFDGAIWNACW